MDARKASSVTTAIKNRGERGSRKFHPQVDHEHQEEPSGEYSWDGTARPGAITVPGINAPY